MESDVDLLNAWRAGDAANGRLLFQRYFQALYRFFANKCDDPDEMVQQTFLAIVKAKDQFAGRSSFRTYLYTVARHELYRHLRGLQRARNFDPALSSIADLATSAGGKLARNQQHKLLCAALRTLPVEQQTLLELHYWDGLDATALAEVFESNAAAIRNRLHRAREKLREAMLATEGIPADTIATVEAVDALALSLR
ncbi:MAG: sigma-70 family RNA polymerase sigma factor [Myxococcales bacterium]|nr:sigma-70 family RNA polymerase sigma factor [Myxococcales bacterium]MBK7196070.1 sigma-70 family RNA polymerase sigma factor [Myxococcales bacterium]MBP6844052.1 sigma-70 family RNA polymerase sigma factor [Kofleriaceae bacterium]